MKVITFLLHTQQPILATSLKGDPNSDVSYDYILGSMIRGALISRYLKLPNNKIKQADDILDSERFPEINRLFFNASKTRYLNAYPVDNNKRGALPVPLSWYKNKGDEFSEEDSKTVYDLSKIPIDKRDKDLSPKLLEEKFCSIDDEDVLLCRVKRRINIHNQRNRKRGKGTDSDGALFSYDAIDAGQTFQGIILCNSENDKTIIETLLKPQDIWLGGSQSAGYGHTIIELIQDNSNITEVQADLKTRLEDKKYLTITLLSDTILRNDCGQNVADPEILRQNISRYLNIKKELEFKENGIYSSSLIVGGFNRKWGLPLPQTPALAAGSVFIFQKADIDLEQLQRLEEHGIGERRIEGFGRLAVNWLDEDITEYEVRLNIPEIQKKQDNSESVSLCQDSLKIAENIAIRIVRRNLDILLTNKVASTEIRKLNKETISNSQLSRLMIVTRRTLSQLEKTESKSKSIVELAQPIVDLIKKENLSSSARSQYERTYLNNNRKLDVQIKEWLENPLDWINLAWQTHPETKNSFENSQPFINIANVTKNIDDYLALEYTFRLIIAILKKTIKETNND